MDSPTPKEDDLNSTNSQPTQGEDSPGSSRPFRIKVFGIGGGGNHLIRHLSPELCEGIEFISVNTDVQTLKQVGGVSFPLGEVLTKGLGAGGDPDIGKAAAEEDEATIRGLCRDADLIVLVSGMGGGTGTGATPVFARIARETQAMVLALVSMPFEFEGARRMKVADWGLKQVRSAADCTVCLPNQTLIPLMDPHAAWENAFDLTREMVQQAIHSLGQLLMRTGWINVDFADLKAVLGGRQGPCGFSMAKGEGEQRMDVAIHRLLNHPFLVQGPPLDEASSILISIQGPRTIRIHEVNQLLTTLAQYAPKASIVHGTRFLEGNDDSIELVLFATPPAQGAGEAPATPRPNEKPSLESSAEDTPVEFDTQFFKTPEFRRPSSQFVPPAPELSPEKKEELLEKQSGGGTTRFFKRRKKIPHLAIVSKNRFENTEPTVFNGQDLDIPTYLRRGIPMN